MKADKKEDKKGDKKGLDGRPDLSVGIPVIKTKCILSQLVDPVDILNLLSQRARNEIFVSQP